MNINRNVLKIVAGVLLMASLPAGAQVLGGGLGGAANGALGGGLGQGVHGSGGIMGGGSITGPDAVGAAGIARDRLQQAGQRTQDTAAQAKDATRSKVGQARGAATATGQATATAGANAGRGAANAAQSGNGAANAAASSNASQGGLLFDGATSGGFEKQALGHEVSADGSTTAAGRADRSGLDASTSKQAQVSARKSEPVEPAPAP
jgi:hypothetical protein